ncbi:MAG TPA: YciI family protein, partial [Terriglobales bacterium]
VMSQIFVVIRKHGAVWQNELPLEKQAAWDAHAKFMDDLYERGIALLVGPMEGTEEALIIMRADSPENTAKLLEGDPWSEMGLLHTTRIARWELRLGSL